MTVSTSTPTVRELLERPFGYNACLRVLVVDDDPITRSILKKSLDMSGYDSALAANGHEGLQMVAEFKPDLILSDWMMPGMDGREFCTRVKSEFVDQAIYFIILTSRDNHTDKVLALETGADEYLVKPCDPLELTARMRAAERVLRLQRSLSRSNEQLQQALRRINAELEASSMIQRCLLSRGLPEIEGYRCAAHYQPSTECSGDFYKVLLLPNGKVGIAIGDVSGHGAPAMVTMTLTHTLLHQEAETTLNPARVLFNLNNKMLTYLPTDQYVTMFYGILDPRTGALTYSSAGHNPPLLADFVNQRHEYIEGCEGFPIKLLGPDMPYDNRQMTIEPGQQLILYTDGLLEAFNPSQVVFGPQRLIATMQKSPHQNPKEIIDVILRDLNEHTGSGQLHDDLSMLIVTRNPAKQAVSLATASLGNL